MLSGSTNVAKRLDVIVYPGNIRRVIGHARAECATSIRFQLITANVVRGQPTPLLPLPAVFVLQSLLPSSIQFRIPIHPSNVRLRVRLDDDIRRPPHYWEQTISSHHCLLFDERYYLTQWTSFQGLVSMVRQYMKDKYCSVSPITQIYSKLTIKKIASSCQM